MSLENIFHAAGFIMVLAFLNAIRSQERWPQELQISARQLQCTPGSARSCARVTLTATPGPPQKTVHRRRGELGELNKNREGINGQARTELRDV